MAPGMLGLVERLNPFKTPEARRLAVLFGVVYFAQGMWYLPNQTITIVLKDRGLAAGQVADFFLLSTIPWLIKPAYGLLSDFVPLFGRRRKSYFLLTCGLAAPAGGILAPWLASSPGSIRTYRFPPRRSSGRASPSRWSWSAWRAAGSPSGARSRSRSGWRRAFPSCRSPWRQPSCARRAPAWAGAASAPPGRR